MSWIARSLTHFLHFGMSLKTTIPPHKRKQPRPKGVVKFQVLWWGVGGNALLIVQCTLGNCPTLEYMYQEKASFLDKLINTLLSPFDRFIFKSNHNIGDDNYMQILNGGKDISKLSEKWLKYYYLHIHSKLYDIMCSVYDGYDNQPEHVFVPVDTELDDLYQELWNTWLIIDRYPFIDALRLGQYNYFKSLNYDTSNRIKVWRGVKKGFIEDIESIGNELPLEPLTNDLKLAFTKIDKLLLEHITKKNLVLFGNIIKHKKVSLNKDQNTVTVDGGKPINITSNELRLLKIVLENIDNTVTYKQVAETLNITAYFGKVDEALKGNIQQIKRDISETLVANNVEKIIADEIRDYLEPVRNTGYIVRSNN